MEKGRESGTSPAAYPTWDIRSRKKRLQGVLSFPFFDKSPDFLNGYPKRDASARQRRG